MTDLLLTKYGAEHNIIEDIRIDIPVETWKIEVKNLSELREQMLVLFSKCSQENEYGGCIREEFITLAFYDNACCDTIQNEVIQEAKWFYVLDNYPIDLKRKDIIVQQFSHLPWKNKLKYPMQDPFLNS